VSNKRHDDTTQKAPNKQAHSAGRSWHDGNGLVTGDGLVTSGEQNEHQLRSNICLNKQQKRVGHGVKREKQ
jgi:hypothetical protein